MFVHVYWSGFLTPSGFGQRPINERVLLAFTMPLHVSWPTSWLTTQPWLLSFFLSMTALLLGRKFIYRNLLDISRFDQPHFFGIHFRRFNYAGHMVCLVTQLSLMLVFPDKSNYPTKQPQLKAPGKIKKTLWNWYSYRFVSRPLASSLFTCSGVHIHINILL